LPESEVAEGDDEGMDEFQDFEMGVDPEEIMWGSVETVYLVRDAGRFLLSTDLPALRGAFAAIDGEPNEVLSDRDDYQGLIGQLGESDAYAAVLMRDFGRFVTANDPMGMMMMLAPMLKQVVGDIQGLGVGIRLDGQTAMIEETAAIYMPNGLAGLSALLDTATPRAGLPSFVGPNTVGYVASNFEFNGLAGAVRPIVQMMQMMMPPEQGAPPIDELIEQVCAAFGKKVHMIQTVEQPVESGAVAQLLAVECVKPEALEHFLATIGPAMGMEPRDFLGHRIYTVDIGDMAMMGGGFGLEPAEPTAIGLGGGYVFSGPASAVEQALRSIGHDDNASLADEPKFQRAMGTLGQEAVVAWGYADVVESMVATMRANRLRMEAIEAMWAEELEDEELDMVGRANPFDIFAELDVDFIERYIGPVSWKVVATDQGFVTRVYLLGANDDED